jgi:hypothetical protein
MMVSENPQIFSKLSNHPKRVSLLSKASSRLMSARNNPFNVTQNISNMNGLIKKYLENGQNNLQQMKGDNTFRITDSKSL